MRSRILAVLFLLLGPLVVLVDFRVQGFRLSVWHLIMNPSTAFLDALGVELHHFGHNEMGAEILLSLLMLGLNGFYWLSAVVALIKLKKIRFQWLFWTEAVFSILNIVSWTHLLMKFHETKGATPFWLGGAIQY